MRASDLSEAVNLDAKIKNLAGAITELGISKDIQVRVFSMTRAEFVINAYVSQENLRMVLLSESQKVLERYKKELRDLGVERDD